MKALAIFANARSPATPQVPTAAEQGLAGVDAYTWNAIFLPKGTPSDIVAKLNAAVSKAMESAQVQERFKALGLDVVAPSRRTPEFLGTYVAAEVEKWRSPIKAAGASEE